MGDSAFSLYTRAPGISKGCKFRQKTDGGKYAEGKRMVLQGWLRGLPDHKRAGRQCSSFLGDDHGLKTDFFADESNSPSRTFECGGLLKSLFPCSANRAVRF